MRGTLPNFDLENELVNNGFTNICGIDEAGRGAFAGPLVAGAVILPLNLKIDGLNDSKKISAKNREKIATEIKLKAIAWSVGIADVDLINTSGIQTATYKAFLEAVSKLKCKPDFLLVDYYKIPNCPIEQNAIKFGDQISASIAAASIIAKTTRDALMTDLSNDSQLNTYQFKNNFGYGTAVHRQAIKDSGLSIHHRISYIHN